MVTPFAIVHTFCASQEGLRNAGFFEKEGACWYKGDFPLAEWNKIRGNVFLTHRWGLGMGFGHVTCKAGNCFLLTAIARPSHPP